MKRKLFWVFGGTCVGKKHYIAEVLRRSGGTVRALWIEDGDEAPREMFESSAGSFIIRWQWGREHLLCELLATRCDIEHVILLITAPVAVRILRVIKREGFLKWDWQMLEDEAEDVLRVARSYTAAGVELRIKEGLQCGYTL